ncbi:aminotransferase family protein-like protein [Xylaria arbuscula]|nr:aminotransferase family protein-like protein [Xylaria arbuscula]
MQYLQIFRSKNSPSMTSSPAPKVPFGHAMREAHFGFGGDYTPINHGSYGTYPLSVRDAHQALREEVEAAPDRFIVLDWPARLRESRALISNFLNCETDELVLVPNATTGSDTVLKNIRWEKGDVVLVYEVVYEAVAAGLQWLVDTFGVRVEVVPLPLPMGDAEIVDAMVGAARRIRQSAGERLRLAIVDTVVSMPGLRIPFEALVPALQAEGALVFVDGAHGIGHVDIDLKTLKPDFFVTSLNKWLFVPRGVSALYVARRHQGLIRTSLPTSVRYRGRVEEGREEDEGAFVRLFDFVASHDMTNFLTVKAALTFRSEICGGEDTIRSYCRAVARQGGEIAAEILGTEIMDAPNSRMRECFFANVRLPLEIAAKLERSSDDAEIDNDAEIVTDEDDSDRERDGVAVSRRVGAAGRVAGVGEGVGVEGKIPLRDAAKLGMWFKETGVRESGFYFQTSLYRDAFWWRLSGMVYVDAEDFRRGAEVLQGLCERASRGEYLGTQLE